MRLDSSGNLGLGVTPSAWGSIFRGIQMSGNSGVFGRTDISQLNLIQNAFFDGASFRYVQNGTAARLSMDSGAYAFATATSGTAGNAISFTQAMTLDASGNLLVGVTTPAQTISTPNVLTLKAPGVAAVWGVGPTTSFGTFYVSNAGIGVGLSQGATSWGTVSDERQKDIIEPITNAASKVASLRSVIGKYKADAEGKRRSFLIAQDVQAVLPEAIDVGEDEAQTLSVKYTEVIPLIVAAIQELKAEFDAYKASHP
jgi:hypothetical protein